MNNNFNIEMYKILNQWNPMKFDDASLGDSEYYEVMDIIHQGFDMETTIHKVKEVYRHNFEAEISKKEFEQIYNQIQNLKLTCEI